MVLSKSLLYVGFLTDTDVMKYLAPARKILPLANLLCTLLDLSISVSKFCISFR
jgi:hypothetical protein